MPKMHHNTLGPTGGAYALTRLSKGAYFYGERGKRAYV